MNVNLGIDLDNTLTNENYLIGVEPHQVDDMHNVLCERLLSYTFKRGIDILKDLPHNIIIVTGRMERFRDVTIDWLDANDITFKSLIMCPDDYYSDTWDVENYHKYKINAYQNNNIYYVLDDDKKLVEILNSLGIKSECVTDNFKESFLKLGLIQNSTEKVDELSTETKSSSNSLGTINERCVVNKDEDKRTKSKRESIDKPHYFRYANNQEK